MNNNRSLKSILNWMFFPFKLFIIKFIFAKYFMLQVCSLICGNMIMLLFNFFLLVLFQMFLFSIWLLLLWFLFFGLLLLFRLLLFRLLLFWLLIFRLLSRWLVTWLFLLLLLIFWLLISCCLLIFTLSLFYCYFLGTFSNLTAFSSPSLFSSAPSFF